MARRQAASNYALPPRRRELLAGAAARTKHCSSPCWERCDLALTIVALCSRHRSPLRQRVLRRRRLSPQRVSIRTLWPSLHPNCCSPCKKAAMRSALPGASARGMSTPMRRMRSLCCARSPSGHAATAPPSTVMNSRRLFRDVLYGSAEDLVRLKMSRGAMQAAVPSAMSVTKTVDCDLHRIGRARPALVSGALVSEGGRPACLTPESSSSRRL